MISALDLELVRTFHTVLEVGGFKLAAARLHKTPAAISMQIKRLEEILGQRVLERNNKGISLTPAGEVLKSKGAQLLALNYELFGELQQEELFGHVRFGAPTDYAPTLLKMLLPIFKHEFPKSDPSIVLEPSRALRVGVNSGAIDIAIVAREPGTIEGAVLWREEIGWFGTAQNSLGVPKVGILKTDCVLRDQAMKDLKSQSVNHAAYLEAATVASLNDAVVAGFCQAYLPITIADQLPRSEDIIPTQKMELPFVMIVGPHFGARETERIADKFSKALAKRFR